MYFLRLTAKLFCLTYLTNVDEVNISREFMTTSSKYLYCCQINKGSHSLSIPKLTTADDRSISGLSMLLAVGHQGCSISTYEYIVICFLVLMALCTHLNAILNIRNYFISGQPNIKKSMVAFTIRTLAILTMIGMAGNLLFARSINTFPEAVDESLAAPAFCYESGSSYNSTTIQSAYSTQHLANQNTGQFTVLLTFIGCCIPLLIIESCRHVTKKTWKWYWIMSFTFRLLMTLGTLGITVWISIDYFKIRYAVENKLNGIFESAASEWSNTNIIGWALLCTSIYGFCQISKFPLFGLYESVGLQCSIGNGDESIKTAMKKFNRSTQMISSA